MLAKLYEEPCPLCYTEWREMMMNFDYNTMMKLINDIPWGNDDCPICYGEGFIIIKDEEILNYDV